jgi:uncharacterized protein (DUF608 family)
MIGGLAGMATLGFCNPVNGEAITSDGLRCWPFRKSPTLNCWTNIDAEGFPLPVSGYVYDGKSLESGVPLGGLGTGYLTLEGDGKLGFSSIYNDLVPPKRIFADWLVVEAGTKAVPMSSAQITYWGHYPVVDLIAHLDELKLEIGLRSFTPFIVGDASASNTPVAIFDLELRNLSGTPLAANLNLQFPIMKAERADEATRGELIVRGVGVVEKAASEGLYSIPVEIPANGARHVQFVVAWYAPTWRDSSNEPRINRYSQRFRSASGVADFALRNSEELLRRVLAWQEIIYRTDLPEWLKDALVQGFYSLAKNSVWIARTRKDDWWSEDGWFTHSESHTGCPIVETIVCRMHGHFALLFFFPELEATTLEGFRHYQIGSGEIPFAFGTPTGMRDPRFTCQHPLNSGEYAQMVYRLYLRSGDKRLLSRFYPSARQAIRYQYTLDDDDCGLVHDHAHALAGQSWPANQFYDIWPWQGTSSYVAGIWLATLSVGEAMATVMGDSSFARECKERLSRAQNAFQEKLWNGSYYRLWSDSRNGRVSEVCLANQLMTIWCTRVVDLQDSLSGANVRTALDTIARLNMNSTSYGLTNGVNPDGTSYETTEGGTNDFPKNIFFGESLCTAMTFIYQGRRDTGLEIARRLYFAVAVKNASPWNQRCLLNGKTGLPQWGDDYYSNLVIWAVPMALAGQSVRQFVREGLAKEMLNSTA